MDSYGVFSLLPPLVALIVAVISRNVILSLGLGVFTGMTIKANGNPFIGLLDTVEKGIFVQLSKPSNGAVLVIITIIGGFVFLLESSGGMKSFAQMMTRVVNSRRKAQLAVWLGGISIFFTDSGNSLILGPIFRPIFAKLKICYEKLAFLIDSTSAPVCVLVPISAWGVYIMSLIEESLHGHQITSDSFNVLMSALPFQFYPWLALLTVPLVIYFNKEYGPMVQAQKKFCQSSKTEKEEIEKPDQDIKTSSAKTIIWPLLTLLAVTFFLFIYFYYSLGKLPGSKVRLSLLFGFLSGSLVCASLLKWQKVYTVQESAKFFFQGMGRNLLMVMILLLAWTLGGLCRSLGTGEYLAALFDGSLNPIFFPAIMFVLGGVVALSTGSSWGTFAILIPIAITISLKINAPLPLVIGAVLSGGIFGDHCSPISDTTLLSSMSTNCSHASHVITQLPYALVTALCALVSFLLAGMTKSSFPLLLGFPLHILLTYFLGRRQNVRQWQTLPAK